MKGTHTLPISLYAKNFVALFVLMVATIVVAQIDLGTFTNNIIAMGIAVTKATLVILFFMGVKYTTRLVQIWAMAGFVWMLLMMITYGDYLTRQPVEGWTPSRETIIGVKQYPGPINSDFIAPKGEVEGH